MSTLEPDLFSLVRSYVAEWPSMSDEDKELRRAHPLVIFVDTLLEQLSTEILHETLVGLTEQTRGKLASRRKTMEAANTDAELQLVLFEVEQMCSSIPGVIYGGDDDEADEFHQSSFPSLLHAIVKWLRATSGDSQVTSVAADVEKAYSSVVLGEG